MALETAVEGRQGIEAGGKGQLVDTLEVAPGLQAIEQVLQARAIDVAIEALAQHLIEQVGNLVAAVTRRRRYLLQIQFGVEKGLAALEIVLQILRQLTELSLESTHITDKSLALLRGFPNLRELNLYHTLIGSQAEAQLKSALPQCHIVWEADSSLPNRRRS